MSQQNLSTTAADFKAPADLFATLTVTGTRATTSGSSTGTTATVAVATGHGIETGATGTVTIAGVTPAGYNGTYTVTATNSTTFTYTTATADMAAISVQGTANFLPNVRVGEKVTAAGGGTARVSGFGQDAGTLRLKGVKGAPSVWSGALTFGTSASPAMSASSFAYTNKLKRIDSTDSTAKTVTEYTYELTDRGFEVKTTGRVTARATAPNQIVSAVRMGLSKSQNTDTSVAPTLTYIIPADATYADGETLTFVITSNEALTVSGTPRVAITSAGPGYVDYAVYVPAKSNSMRLVFEYQNNSALTDAGQIDSIAYNANGATITDVGGGAVTPDWSGIDLTGIILA